MTGTFQTEVDEFVDTLNDVLGSTIDISRRFSAKYIQRQSEALIEPFGTPENNGSDIPLRLEECAIDDTPLFLRLKYHTSLDQEGDHLIVKKSTFGLLIDVTAGKRNPRPFIRMEYDRRRMIQGRALAHVHLHANSPELAWLYGKVGQPAPDLHALHIPSGGRRFRPTFEEFLLFLDRERLYTSFKEGWHPKVLDSLDKWERRQAQAVARRYPEEVAASLEALGYTVTRSEPPPNCSNH